MGAAHTRLRAQTSLLRLCLLKNRRDVRGCLTTPEKQIICEHRNSVKVCEFQSRSAQNQNKTKTLYRKFVYSKKALNIFSVSDLTKSVCLTRQTSSSREKDHRQQRFSVLPETKPAGKNL
ncbi:hypothetical protein [Acetobacter malorum]|uniref:hypothetical protein n=1 Tax=Acetobacter malorum TaxID=178901 RepID=UPI0039EC0E8B